MSSRRDMILALTIAAGLHGAALLSVDLPAGGVASGSGGQASISIAAAAPGLRAVVDTWETPPKVVEEVTSASPPEAETPTKPVGAWDDNPVTKTPVNRIEMPEVLAAPKIASTGVRLSHARVVETTETLASFAKDAALRRSAPTKPTVADPDASVDSGKPPESALVAAKRTTARPAREGDDEAIASRVARGAGGDVTRGQSHDVAATVAVSPGAAKAAQAAWAAAIQRRIARHQQFPKSARGTGRVRLTMVIRADGRLIEVQIARSSGKASFDRAAVFAAKKAAPFPAAPKALSEPWYRVGQWVNFGR